MSIAAQSAIVFAIIVILIIAGAVFVVGSRPVSSPPATTPTLSPLPSPSPEQARDNDTNPFSANASNPFEDEEYNNSFTEETDETYVNPFSE